MKKIPTVYVRDEADRSKVTDEVNPQCQWVLDGEGVPTRKYDGTCVLLDEDGQWWARREVKRGKTPPPNYRAEQHDEVTGKTVGWEPIEQSPFAKMHAQAVRVREEIGIETEPGTYELVGPKINGNPERFGEHRLLAHATAERPGVEPGTPPKFLVEAVGRLGWEGIVWHWPQPDGTVKMAKLKARDLPSAAGTR